LDDFRKLLHRAQTAEVKGDFVEAMACLRLAATLCQEAGMEAKAQKMLRHLSRLEVRAPPPPPSGLENAVATLKPPWVCVLCTEEVPGGWRGENGRWICRVCLQKARFMLKRSPVCALCAGDVSGGWQGESGTWICKACVEKARPALGTEGDI